MSLLLAPYNNAMRLGQGFNSYTHEICIDDAVVVSPMQPENVLTNDGNTMRLTALILNKASAWTKQDQILLNTADFEDARRQRKNIEDEKASGAAATLEEEEAAKAAAAEAAAQEEKISQVKADLGISDEGAPQPESISSPPPPPPPPAGENGQSDAEADNPDQSGSSASPPADDLLDKAVDPAQETDPSESPKDEAGEKDLKDEIAIESSDSPEPKADAESTAVKDEPHDDHATAADAAASAKEASTVSEEAIDDHTDRPTDSEGNDAGSSQDPAADEGEPSATSATAEPSTPADDAISTKADNDADGGADPTPKNPLTPQDQESSAEWDKLSEEGTKPPSKATEEKPMDNITVTGPAAEEDNEAVKTAEPTTDGRELVPETPAKEPTSPSSEGDEQTSAESGTKPAPAGENVEKNDTSSSPDSKTQEEKPATGSALKEKTPAAGSEAELAAAKAAKEEEEKKKRAEEEAKAKAAQAEALRLQRERVEWNRAIQRRGRNKDMLEAADKFKVELSLEKMAEMHKEFLLPKSAHTLPGTGAKTKVYSIQNSTGVSQTVVFQSRLVDKLSDVTSDLGVSAALSVKKGSCGGSGRASFIDTDKFKSSDMNYYISVKVVNQSINFRDALEFNSLDNIGAEAWMSRFLFLLWTFMRTRALNSPPSRKPE
ncbi:unnamed protein product [Tilletia controversa]|nr:unnamed protein product [Tilletia controversa]